MVSEFPWLQNVREGRKYTGVDFLHAAAAARIVPSARWGRGVRTRALAADTLSPTCRTPRPQCAGFSRTSCDPTSWWTWSRARWPACGPHSRRRRGESDVRYGVEFLGLEKAA